MTRYAGLGYMEVGLCFNCHTPNHLFVSSVLDVNQPYRCIACVVSQSVRSAYGTDTDADELYRSANPIAYPVIQSLDVCAGCLKPEIVDDVSYHFVQAYLADQTTVVSVHNICTLTNCEDCEFVYAFAGRRGWRSFEQLNAPENQIISSNSFTTFENIDGDYYCESCKNNHMEACGGENMFTYCRSCERTIHLDNTAHFDGTTYCQSCYDDNVYSCDDCGDHYWDEDGHDCDYTSDVIHNYSYKPSPQFFGSGRYHLGFELEVETRDENRYEGAEYVQEALGGRVYIKDDGSLNDGFEVVTHPHTLEEYQKNFDWRFLKHLQRRGYRSWNTSTCGIHVHVSRCAFGDVSNIWSHRYTDSERSRYILRKQAHELRFMKLIYDNQRQVERIAGRSSSHYATFEDKGKLVDKVKFGSQSNGRYSAINTENDATIEVRVFRGSLRKERVMSAIEFVTASVEYTRNLKVTSKNHALSWLGLSSYVMSNIEQYPNLATIMSESFASDETNEQGEN